MTTDNSSRYDFVVFGASGFTGQYVVEEVARVADEENGLTWAISGRDMGKLQKILETASVQTGKKLETIPIIIADVGNDKSLLDMCEKAKVVLNCVGPYRFYGPQVVRACIEKKAHHVDISGEPQFLENMQLLYSAKASEAGVYVIGACGYDSIPADMGVLFAKKEFKGDLNTLEAFMKFHTIPGYCVNTGTYESAIHGFNAAGQLAEIRKKLFPNPLPRSSHKLIKRSPVFYSDKASSWCVPFLGSDRSVVNRTNRFLYDFDQERPVQFGINYCVGSIWRTIGLIFFGLIFSILSKFSFGKTLLSNYPGIFTAGFFKKGGPTRKQIEGCTFAMTFYGKGYSKKIDDADAQHTEAPDKTIVIQVLGPEAGYVTTPICMVQAGIVILKEQNKLPPGGGVFTPGAAFSKTTMIDRLDKHQVTFKVLTE